jgi:cytochrome c oxidase subunit 2
MVQDKANKLLADGKSAEYERFTKEYNPEAAAQGFVNVKAQGNQWNWTYTYPDITDDAGYPLEFVSNPLQVGCRPIPKKALATCPSIIRWLFRLDVTSATTRLRLM